MVSCWQSTQELRDGWTGTIKTLGREGGPIGTFQSSDGESWEAVDVAAQGTALRIR